MTGIVEEAQEDSILNDTSIMNDIASLAEELQESADHIPETTLNKGASDFAFINQLDTLVDSSASNLLYMFTKETLKQKRLETLKINQTQQREENMSVLPVRYTHTLSDSQSAGSSVLDKPMQQLESYSLSDTLIKQNLEAETSFTLLDRIAELPFQESPKGSLSCCVIDNSKEIRGFEMWWYDAYSDENKGDIYLFGKHYENPSDGYTSCCAIVQNIQREIYVLPRKFKLSDTGSLSESVSASDVIEEIESILTSKNIRVWETNICTRKYVFGLPDVPFETQYIKVNYSYKDPEIPRGLTGETFQHVFGVSSSPLERFIIDRKIVGPGWISFKQALLAKEQHTWSKTNVIIRDPNSCEVVQTSKGDPPLKVLSVKCQKSVKNEILSISGVLTYKDLDDLRVLDQNSALKFSAIRLFSNTSFPDDIGEILKKEKLENSHDIRLERSEFALLSYISAKINQIDPDVIVGHKVWNSELNMIFQKMKQNNIVYWHKLGRLQLQSWPRINTSISDKLSYSMRLSMSGRLICDTFLASQELVRCKSYDLSELAKSQLNIEREELDLSNLSELYKSGEGLLKIANHGLRDAYISLCIAFKLQALQLSLQLTRIAGNLWSSNIDGGSHIDRNEYLLQHAFYGLGYICPDKKYSGRNFRNEAGDSSTKSDYSGGLVLEPKPGLYKKYVILLDFNSLYPSIIREYNMCFTTLRLQDYSSDDIDTDKAFQESGVDKPTGILSKIIEKFVTRRQHIKSLMLNPEASPSLLKQYDVEQKALKLIANTIYGCLGSPYSRFYAKALAMSITAKGRYILQNTTDLANETEELSFKKTKKLAISLKKQVNSLYKQLQIDVDCYFKSILLVKKKRYAAIKVVETLTNLEEVFEAKGIEVNRKDFCDFSQNSLRNVLDMFFSKRDRSEITESIYKYLKELVSTVRNLGASTDEFIIRKKISKSMEEYKGTKRYPHVIVAEEMKRRGCIVHAGDYINFFMCKDGKQGEEHIVPKVLEDVYTQSFKIDYNWYIINQIVLPIARLYDPIGNLDIHDLMKHIDVEYDTTKKKSKKNNPPNLYLSNDPKRFDSCEKLHLICALCEYKTEFNGLIIRSSNSTILSSLTCHACGKKISTANVLTQTILAIRSYVKKYYQSAVHCDNPLCGFESRVISPGADKCPINECYGKLNRKYSERMLYLQLNYLLHLFSIEKYETNLQYIDDENMSLKKLLEKERHTFSVVKSELRKYIECSDYRYININKIMKMF
ncbi:hypothetical protein BY458DRAFT_511383 [Sporodiniella umbellata]|nr:hypothetical protein BY458DRAFT_511383 [Sporodiniella umbellata]